MKKLLLGMVVAAMFMVPAMAQGCSDNETMAMTIAQYCTISINNWASTVAIEETASGKNTHIGILLNDPMYIFGYNDGSTPGALGGAVAIDINAPAKAYATVTGRVLTGTVTGHTLVAGACIGAGTTPASYPGCLGEVGDDIAYPLRLDYTGGSTPIAQPGYNGPGLCVEVARSIYDRADDYTGEVVVTVIFD